MTLKLKILRLQGGSWRNIYGLDLVQICLMNYEWCLMTYREDRDHIICQKEQSKIIVCKSFKIAQCVDK